MKWGYTAVLLACFSTYLAAQKVLYSPYINDRNTDKFEIIGKSGDYYWVQKNKRKNQVVLPAMPWSSDREPVFEIYDSHLNETGSIPAPIITDSTMKEYYVSGSNYFDELILLKGNNQTLLSVQRYTADGQLIAANKIIDTLSFSETGNSFLLLRSENKSKLLLLCFKMIEDAPLELHALLFNQDWHLLSYNKYHHPYITQPFVQYEFFNYPVEHFGIGAVKLTNNGDWAMVAPSGRNHDFSLFHFNGMDTTFVYKDIRLPASSSVEDVALSADNEKQEAIAGILSRFRYSTLKNVEVAKYSFTQKKIVYDSSFRFNTLTGDKVQHQNLYEESFVAVPKGGFMLLKEYGKDYPQTDRDYNGMINPVSDKELVFSNGISTNDSEPPVKNDEYTRYKSLGGPRSYYKRGDLSLFYFPSGKEDSCWSGIINKEQTTELNSSYLSYAVVPAAGRLFFLYNSFIWKENQYGSSTVLDRKGEEMQDEGIVFSNLRNTLLFQKARQILDNEMAVPYSNLGRNGFAIIKF
jgi:hypothetical protein